MQHFFVLKFSSGLQLKKLDKKLERALLHSYRKVCVFVVNKVSINPSLVNDFHLSSDYVGAGFNLSSLF